MIQEIFENIISGGVSILAYISYKELKACYLKRKNMI